MIIIIVDGKKIKDELINLYKEEINKNNYHIKLATICIGNDEASKIYVRNKIKVCSLVNIECEDYYFEEITEEELKALINKLNNDDSITGIMIELPLPKIFNNEEIINLIKPSKDVDGLTKDSNITPCTALAVLEILNYYNINLEHKNIALIGYSGLIGKPLKKYFLDNKYNVTVCNTKTTSLKEVTLNSDVIISATGVYNLITEDMVKNDSIIIDCGIIRKDDKLHGDVDFDNVVNKAKLITPVPNGVGPITTVMVVKNLISLYNLSR